MDHDPVKPLEPFKMFYSYSHEDRRLRNKLAQHLAQLRDEGLIEDWYDDQIVPGSNFNEVIRDKMDQADLMLLLVSAAFLASAYVRDFELPRAYDREKQGRLVLLPILLKPVGNWRKHPLFASRQSPLSGDLAITERRDREKAFAKIEEGVRRAVEDLGAKRSASLGGSLAPASVLGQAAALCVDRPGLALVIDGHSFLKFEDSVAGRDEASRLRAYLWLPTRQTLREKLPDYFVVGVVRDLGPAEEEAASAQLEGQLDRLEPYYASSFANLKPEAREEILEVASLAMTGQSVNVLAIPRALIGESLVDLNFVYELLLNLIVPPLCNGPGRPPTTSLELILNPIDDAGSGKKPLEGYAKKVLKTRFAAGHYRVTQRTPRDRGDFFLFHARFLQWAGSRSYNEGNPDWLRKLEAGFEKSEGLPGGSPSS